MVVARVKQTTTTVLYLKNIPVFAIVSVETVNQRQSERQATGIKRGRLALVNRDIRFTVVTLHVILQ